MAYRHGWIGAAALALALALGVRAEAAGLTVRTSAGTLRGIATAGADEFLGIPYAAPPVGALRWQPPQPVSWTGTLPADALPSPCPQPASASGVASTDEDCLDLNVYRPTRGGSALAVMVWVHGGAYETGTGDQYDGTALVQDGVIVVTINYRLGYLGFLAHPALDAGSRGGSGDYGLMDQQAALRWVKRNIAAFGGDPGNVTVFGQSAGGQSIYDHLVSPGASGLFERAIIESGAYAVQLPSQQTAEANGVSFAHAVGCTSTTDPTCLRALSVQQILALEATPGRGSSAALTQFEPNVGPSVLPVQPLFAISLGVLNRVPVLQGSNHDEARLFTFEQFDAPGTELTTSGYPGAIAALVGQPLAPLVEAAYPLAAYASPDLAYSALFTDAGFSCGARGFDQLLSHSVPTFAYEFADENAARLLLPADPFMPLGAPHTSELPFLWPALIGVNGPAGASMSADEVTLSTHMRAAWTNFAKTGNPNGAGATSWPGYGASDEFLQFVPAATHVTTGFAADHKCALWEPVLTLEGVLPPGVL